jgi:radical SAM superfamily enzyme YgiQ (UPF0313 family)
MKLLLVSIHIERNSRAVPLGAAMLVSSLHKHCPETIEPVLLNLYLNQTAAECAEMILKQTPKAVGFSIYLWNRVLSLEIADILKKQMPDIILFAGGPEASADYNRLLKNSALDFALMGECEESVVVAMKHLLEYKSPNNIEVTTTPASIKDLAKLPSPYLDGTINLADYSGVLWELSRGCPFKCAFCYESRGTSGIRRFPIDRVRSELQLFVKAEVAEIFVLDPTFNYNRKASKEMLRLIIKEAPLIDFFFEIRSEFIDEEMAKLFACVNGSIQIGLQSSSNKVLKCINRTIDKNDFENKILLLHQAGATYGFDLIYGLPHDTYKGFCKSLDFAMSLMPNHVDIFPLSVLPGTELHDTAANLGIKHLADNPYMVTSSETFSEHDMQRAKDLAAAFNLFYNGGRAVPWFESIRDALNISPSKFFTKFAEKIKTEPKTNIVLQQINFVSELLRKTGKEHLVSVACDIIGYFGYDEYLFDENMSLEFEHDPEELIELIDSGITDLRELANSF